MLENVEYVKADSFSNSTIPIPANEIKTASPVDVPRISIVEDVKKIEIPQTSNAEDNPYWMMDCLDDAKNVIIEFHDEKPEDRNFVDCRKFFAGKIFDVKLQNSKNISGDISLIKGLTSQLSYKIYVHNMFREDTRDNRRMITVILIHQLLHAIHPSRNHDFSNGQKGINRLEHEISNKAQYHDALLNLESLHQSGKINPCNV